MDISQAKELLKIHSYIHEVMYAMKVLEPLFSVHEFKIDRQIISAIWGICHLSREWGIHPDGMLRRNNLITSEDVSKLETWLGHISYTFYGLLDGLQEEAFEEYVSEYGDFKCF